MKAPFVSLPSIKFKKSLHTSQTQVVDSSEELRLETTRLGDTPVLPCFCHKLYLICAEIPQTAVHGIKQRNQKATTTTSFLLQQSPKAIAYCGVSMLCHVACVVCCMLNVACSMFSFYMFINTNKISTANECSNRSLCTYVGKTHRYIHLPQCHTLLPACNLLQFVVSVLRLLLQMLYDC